MVDTNLGSIKISVTGDLNQAVSAVTSFSDTVSKATASIGEKLKELGKGFAGIETLVSAAFAGKSLDKFKELDEAFGRLRRGLGQTAAQFDPVRRELTKFALESNTSLLSLVEGMHKFDFATRDIPTLMALAKTSAQGAKVAFTDASTAADTLSTVLQSFQLPLSSAADVMAKLTTATETGRAGMAELGQALSVIAPQARQAGVSFEEALSIIKVLATETGNAAEASSKFRIILSKLEAIDASSKAGAKLAEVLGLTVQQSIRLNGLIPTLERLAGTSQGVKELTDALDGTSEGIASLGVGERSIVAIQRLLADSAKIASEQQELQSTTAADLARKYRDQKTSITELAKETGKLATNAVLAFYEAQREKIAGALEVLNKFISQNRELVVRVIEVGLALSTYAIALSSVKFVLVQLGSTFAFLSDAVKLFSGLLSGKLAGKAIDAVVDGIMAVAAAMNFQRKEALAAAAANAAYSAASLRGSLGAQGIGVVAGTLRGPGGKFASSGIAGVGAAEAAAVASGTASAISGPLAQTAPVLTRFAAQIAAVTGSIGLMAAAAGALGVGLYAIGKAAIDSSYGVSQFTLELQRLRGERFESQFGKKQAADLRDVGVAAEQLKERYDALASAVRTASAADSTPDEKARAVKEIDEQTKAIDKQTKSNLAAKEALEARIAAIKEEAEAGRRAFVERNLREFAQPVSTEGGIGAAPTANELAAERARLEVKARNLSLDDALRESYRGKIEDEKKLAAAVDKTTQSLQASEEAVKVYDQASIDAARQAGDFATKLAGIQATIEINADKLDDYDKKLKLEGMTEGEREIAKYDERLELLTATLKGVTSQLESLGDLSRSGANVPAGVAAAAQAQFDKVLGLIERIRKAREEAIEKEAADEVKKRAEALGEIDRIVSDALQKEGKLKAADELAAEARYKKEIERAGEVRRSKIKGADEIADAIERAAERGKQADLKAADDAEKKRRESTEAYAKLRQEQEKEIAKAEALATAEILRRQAAEAKARGDLRTERDLRDKIAEAIRASGDETAKNVLEEGELLQKSKERLELLKEEIKTRLRTGEGGVGSAISGAERDIAGASDAASLRGSLRERFRQTTTPEGARELFGVLRQLIEAEFRTAQGQLGQKGLTDEDRIKLQQQLKDAQEKARIATEELTRALKEIANRGPSGKTPIVVDSRRLQPGEAAPPGATIIGTPGAAPAGRAAAPGQKLPEFTAPAAGSPEAAAPSDGLDLLSDSERAQLIRAQRSGNVNAFEKLKARLVAAKRNAINTGVQPDTQANGADFGPPKPDSVGDSGGGQKISAGAPASGIGSAIKDAIGALKTSIGDLTTSSAAMGKEIVDSFKELSGTVAKTVAATNQNTKDIASIRADNRSLRVEGRTDGDT